MPDSSKPFEVETNASDFAIGGVLRQRDANGRLHPVAYLSKKFGDAQRKYIVYDKELIAIVIVFKDWKPYFSNTEQPVQVYTDYQNLEYFTKKQDLSRR